MSPRLYDATKSELVLEIATRMSVGQTFDLGPIYEEVNARARAERTHIMQARQGRGILYGEIPPSPEMGWIE